MTSETSELSDSAYEVEEACEFLERTITAYSMGGGIGVRWRDLLDQAKQEGIRERPLHIARLRMCKAGLIVKVYNPSFLGEVQQGAFWQDRSR